jgi:hypothetical protein
MLKLHPRLNGRWFVYQKKEGGLGVLRLETHNESLLLKNFDKFFNKADTPWVHLVLEKHFNNGKFPNHTLRGFFWWRDILRLLDKFKSLASITVHKGYTCFIWHDLWGGSIRSQGLPQMYSFARSKNVSVCKASSVAEIN